MAKKKQGGSIKNGRDSKSKRLGIKLYDGNKVKSGNILYRQRGQVFRNGINTRMGKDYTIYSLVNGIVHYINNEICVI